MQHMVDFSLRNRLLIIVVALLVMAAGYASYRQLPVDAFPDVTPTLVQVFTVTEGLAPEEIEKYVTYPVEVSMNGLPGIEQIRSVSNFGLSVVNIYFKDNTDIYFARQLVNERLQEAREQIPEGFGQPAMGPISTAMGLVLFYYLEDETGTRSLEELRSIQDWLIKFHLQTVPGVTEVLGIGGYERQFHIIVDPDALLRYDVTINEVGAAIEANNLNVGAQFIEKGSEEFIVRSVGLARNVADLGRIVIKSEDGTPVYLEQLGGIKIGGAVRRGLQTLNGATEVVAGQVIKLYGTNSSTVIEAVQQRMKEINEILPEGVTIVPYYDQAWLVGEAVSTVISALLQGIILVGAVLLFFMGGLTSSLVVGISVPFSVMFAFVLMRYFGISANLMSLGGLAIAIGMMVDGTIVMVENIERHLRESDPSESRLHVIARASHEVVRPIVFAISIIIIVFLPLFTLQGVEGKMFRPLAYTVAMAMTGSLVFAILIAPVTSSLLMRPHRSASGGPQKEFFVLRWLIRAYEPVVSFFVRQRAAAVVLSLLLLAVGILLYPRLGAEFTPEMQEGTIVVKLTMAPSISLEESRQTAMRIERIVRELPEVSRTVTRVGRGEVGAHTDPVNSAEMFVELTPQSAWRGDWSQEELTDVIRDHVGDVPGVRINYTQPIAMTVDELMEGVQAELAIKVFGEDLETLERSGNEIAAAVSRVPGAAEVQVAQVSGTPQLLITIDREAVARYGINVADAQQVIQSAVGGAVVGQILEGVKRFDILVRYAPEFRNSSEAIERILVSSPTGIRVPLAQIATVREITGPRQITREGNQRFITIQCNVRDRDIVSFVEEGQLAIKDNVDLPAGYLVRWGGQFRLQQEANKRLAVVVPVTLFVVLLLLFSSFNSLKNAMLILLNIPLALVGGVAALWVTGQNLSVPASVGFIALFGIALENGMVLITYLNQLLHEGMPIDKASVHGACLRVRAVLMTALTTALGLIPLLLSHGTGSEVQRPLATVVVGGLATSTVLTLLVLPSLYKWFAIAPARAGATGELQEETR